LAPIVALGFDVGALPGTIRLTAQIAPPPAAGVAGGEAGAVKFRVITVEGATVTEALTLLLGHIRREPFLMHLGFIVFGAEFARAGLGAVIGGLQGTITIRGSVPVLAAAGPAEAVLRARSGIGRAPGEDVLALLSNMQRAPLGVVVTFYDVVNTLSGLGGELVLPILDLTPLRLEAGDHRPDDGTGQQGQQLMEVVIGRTALFKRDRLVYELDVFQTQMLVLLKGEVGQGAMSIVHPTAPGGAMAVRFLRFRPQLTPTVRDNKAVSLQISIKIDASLAETRAGYDLRKDGPQPILQVLEEQVTLQAVALVGLLQQLGVDSLGVGSIIYRRQPRAWSHLEPRWNELYKQMPVQIEAKARLKDTGMVARPFAVRRQ
jgi:spore germination protein KC